MKKIIILCFALGAFHTLDAQETLTLSQCLQMAVVSGYKQNRKEGDPLSKTIPTKLFNATARKV